METFAEFWDNFYYIIKNKKVLKAESDVVEGHVTIYWAGSIIRIDLKPKEEK